MIFVGYHDGGVLHWAGKINILYFIVNYVPMGYIMLLYISAGVGFSLELFKVSKCHYIYRINFWQNILVIIFFITVECLTDYERNVNKPFIILYYYYLQTYDNVDVVVSLSWECLSSILSLLCGRLLGMMGEEDMDHPHRQIPFSTIVQ